MSTQPPLINHIELRPNRDGQMRAYVAGTRVRVQDIVSDHERHGLSAEEIAREYSHVTLAQVYAALAYFYDHQDELREQMIADEQYARRVEMDQNRVQSRLSPREPNGDSVPS